MVLRLVNATCFYGARPFLNFLPGGFLKPIFLRSFVPTYSRVRSRQLFVCRLRCLWTMAGTGDRPWCKGYILVRKWIMIRFADECVYLFGYCRLARDY